MTDACPAGNRHQCQLPRHHPGPHHWHCTGNANANTHRTTPPPSPGQANNGHHDDRRLPLRDTQLHRTIRVRGLAPRPDRSTSRASHVTDEERADADDYDDEYDPADE